MRSETVTEVLRRELPEVFYGPTNRARVARPVTLSSVSPKTESRPSSLKFSLTDGRIMVDGRTVPLPRGLGTLLTGAAIKRLAGVYRRFNIYVKAPGGLQRIKDRDVLELLPGTEVVSRDDRPEIFSLPSYIKD